jgi:hypothetical protein
MSETLPEVIRNQPDEIQERFCIMTTEGRMPDDEAIRQLMKSKGWNPDKNGVPETAEAI